MSISFNIESQCSLWIPVVFPLSSKKSIFAKTIPQNGNTLMYAKEIQKKKAYYSVEELIIFLKLDRTLIWCGKKLVQVGIWNQILL